MNIGGQSGSFFLEKNLLLFKSLFNFIWLQKFIYKYVYQKGNEVLLFWGYRKSMWNTETIPIKTVLQNWAL